MNGLGARERRGRGAPGHGRRAPPTQVWDPRDRPKKKTPAIRLAAKAGTSPSAWLSRDRPVSSIPVASRGQSGGDAQWTGCDVADSAAWVSLRVRVAERCRGSLQASRSFRQVRCQDDRGSYPRPVPKRYRLAQNLPLRLTAYCLLEVPPSGLAVQHSTCHDAGHAERPE